MDTVNKHELIRNTIVDLVSKFLYYDRKEDEDLGVGDIEIAVDEGVITQAEIVEIFADELSRKF